VIHIKSKKGAEIALNTIIIAIIVLVVLVIIIAFFAGGASSVIDKIRSIFTGKTEGQDMALAIQNCQEYCDQAKQLKQSGATQQAIMNSPYCTQWVKLDYNPKDGVADKTEPDQSGTSDFKRYYCSFNNKDAKAEPKYLGTDAIAVGCSINCATGM